MTTLYEHVSTIEATVADLKLQIADLAAGTHVAVDLAPVLAAIADIKTQVVAPDPAPAPAPAPAA